MGISVQSADIANLHIGNFTQQPLLSASGVPVIWKQYAEDTFNGNNFPPQPTLVERAVEVLQFKNLKW